MPGIRTQDPLTSERADVAGKATLRDSLLIFGAAFFVYLLLRSRFYIGDGVRGLPFMLTTVPHDGGNAHFLPFYVGWLVLHVWGALGLTVSGGDGPVNTHAIELLQGFNALAAAVALVVLYLWLRDVASRRAALIAVVVAGFSNAFLMHATDATEPIAAVAPMMLGLWILNRAPDRIWIRLVAGALIGFGADFYEIAFIALAPAVWIAACSRSPSSLWPGWSRLVPAGLALGGAGLATHTGLIAFLRYAFATWPEIGLLGGRPSGLDILGSLNPKHFAAGIFGFTNSVGGFPDMPGMSSLLHQTPLKLIWALGATFLALAFAAGLVRELAKSRPNLVALGLWPYVVAAGGWFALVVLVVCFFSPLYEKFWVFSAPPLAMAVALAIEPRGDGARESALDARVGNRAHWPLFLIPVAILLLMSLTLGALPRRFGHNEDVEVAARLADRLRPEDLCVSPGWDSTGIYMRTILKRPVYCFSLTDETLALADRSSVVERRLAPRIEAARARGGRVYFIALLGDSPAEWDTFFGSRLNVPYEALAPYRSKAVALETLPAHPPVVLYELQP